MHFIKNIIGFFRRRKKPTHDELVLKAIRIANVYYLAGDYLGMCDCLSRGLKDVLGSDKQKSIYGDIPEFWRFRPYGKTGADYWWDVLDRGARIRTFNELIKIYERKCNEQSTD